MDTERQIADDFSGDAAKLMRTLDPAPATNLCSFLTRWQQDAVMVAQLLSDDPEARTDAMDAMDGVRVLVVGAAFAAIVESNGAGVITVSPEDPTDAPTDPTAGTLLDAALSGDAATAPKLPAGYVDEGEPDEDMAAAELTPVAGRDHPVDAEQDITAPAPVPGRDHPIDQAPPGA